MRTWRGVEYYDGINMLYFSTFFGGNTGDWAPGGDQEAEFDNFVICSPSGPPADVPKQEVSCKSSEESWHNRRLVQPPLLLIFPNCCYILEREYSDMIMDNARRITVSAGEAREI
jgi:hypothetical protein